MSRRCASLFVVWLMREISRFAGDQELDKLTRKQR